MNILILVGLLILPGLIVDASRKERKHSGKKRMEMKHSELKTKLRSMVMTEEEPQQFVTEEYERKVMKVERRGGYLIGFIDVPSKKKSSVKERVEYLDPRAATYDKRKIRRENRKIKGIAMSTHFNGEVDTISDASSVPDEYPCARPTADEDNTVFNDFFAVKTTKLVHQIANEIGDFDIPYIEDGSDVLALVIAPANFYTPHHYEYDAFMTGSLKEENMHIWRNPKIHPKQTYVRENEVQATVPHYDIYDVETSQKDMETHFGREIGRDAKPKTCANRDTFSSINAGCSIM